ncbi:MAG: hypothetical protein GAK36_00200 [Pseudomonas sp.]|nr:MAG: hypothetical protein GAK36_00200 [Pseudomonas sp.]
MLWNSIVPLVIACAISTSAVAGTDPLKVDFHTQNLPNLVGLYGSLNEACRGGSGDSPETQRYCDRRDEAYSEIESRGWCWGPDDAIGADKSWIACPKGAQSLTSIPRFKAAEYCKQLASVGGAPSEVIYGSCMEMEQAAYDDLKPAWPSIPTSMQAHCTMLATVGSQGSYTVLQSCIQQEKAARSTNSSSSFRY